MRSCVCVQLCVREWDFACLCVCEPSVFAFLCSWVCVPACVIVCVFTYLRVCVRASVRAFLNVRAGVCV